MGTPRLPLLSPQDTHLAAQEAQVHEFMENLSIFRVLLHHPPVARRIQDLLLTLLFGSKLDARLRELLIMRIGWTTGSVYEWTQHWRVALDLGVSERDLLAVRDWERHDHWSAADRAVLTATDEVLAEGAISGKTWQQCADVLPGTEELIELIAAIGTWRMISEILRSLEVPLEEGVEPWPPEGNRP